MKVIQLISWYNVDRFKSGKDLGKSSIYGSFLCLEITEGKGTTIDHLILDDAPLDAFR